MKTLIVYATNHGTTESVARKIQEKAHGEITLINLKHQEKIDLHPYDQVIIGGSIHAGLLQKRVRQFYEKNMSILLQKPIGLFLSCMEENKAQEQFDRAYPEILRTHASSKQITGGAFNMDKMNFIERAIVKKVAGITESISNIKEDRIEALIKEMNL